MMFGYIIMAFFGFIITCVGAIITFVAIIEAPNDMGMINYILAAIVAYFTYNLGYNTFRAGINMIKKELRINKVKVEYIKAEIINKNKETKVIGSEGNIDTIIEYSVTLRLIDSVNYLTIGQYQAKEAYLYYKEGDIVTLRYYKSFDKDGHIIKREYELA